MPGAHTVTDAVVVARDQAVRLPDILARMPSRVLRSVVVVDGGSGGRTEQAAQTAQQARDAGCIVLREPRPGYGAACLRAQAHLAALPHPPDVAVFASADDGDDPADIPALLAPIGRDNAELVIGVRPRRSRQPGTRVALGLIGAIYGHRFDDLATLRAIRFPALVALGMSDTGAGWNVEMQIKALKLGLHLAHVPIADELPARGLAEARGARSRHARERVSAGGRTLFQILRHAITR